MNEKELLEHLYHEKKMSLTQIAKHLHIPRSTVNRHFKALKIEKRSRGGPNRQKVLSLLEQDGVNIKKIVSETPTLSKAATKLGVHLNTLKEFLKND